MSLLGMAAGSFALALSGAVVPGPLLAVVVAQVPRQGVRAAWLVVAAHSFCEFLVVLGLWSGVLKVMTAPKAAVAISGAGAVALLVLGALTARLALRGQGPEVPAASGTAGARSALTAGLAATALNPYWLGWWATVAPSYMANARLTSALAVGVFYLAHISGDFAWYVPVAVGLRAGQRRLSAGPYRAVLAVSAAFLVGLGRWFGVEAVRGALGVR